MATGNTSDADTIILEDVEIEQRVRSILPNISEVKLKSLMECFVQIGVTSPPDLYLLEADDMPMLNIIERRKLINAWKREYGTSTIDTGRKVE